MRMNAGVEWAAHSCINLAWIGNDRPIPAARLAEFYELPPAYLNKQLQALARANILTSVSGPRGGFRLARPLTKISLMDVVAAIEGNEDMFRCSDIRFRGASGGGRVPVRPAPCSVATGFRKAEVAYRRELAAQTLNDIMASAEHASPGTPERVRRWFTDT